MVHRDVSALPQIAETFSKGAFTENLKSVRAAYSSMETVAQTIVAV